ncbi:hypothetical protein EON66_12430, partial [archaeon]
MHARCADMAYDLDTNNATNGDEFMVNEQGYGAYIPVHTCPGNHESAKGMLMLGVARLSATVHMVAHAGFHSPIAARAGAVVR